MNPWENVSLSDYEEHMKSPEVSQLQTLNAIMKEQFCSFDACSIAVLGVAGGNGLEHADKKADVIGLDINQQYLDVCTERFSGMEHLKLIKADIADTEVSLPQAEFVIADLIIEYTGVDVFIKQLKKIDPKRVSCVIQKNGEASFVSKSGYEDKLTGVCELHSDIDKAALTEAAQKAGFKLCLEKAYDLPGGKQFMRLDFEKKTAPDVLVAYFSGTGGTALAAKRVAEALESRGACVKLREIRYDADTENGSEDYFILLFPVHAFNAPQPVYKWLERLGSVNGISAAVISVSGGGEVFPNTAMRRSCIKRLKKKGYSVIYEDSVVMPSNIFTRTPEPAETVLLQVLPQRAAMIAEDILAGRCKVLKAKLIDRAISRMGEMEKPGAKLFGRHLIADQSCNKCGKCVRNCPTGNIRMEQKPVFGKECSLCLRCVYSCPENAIMPKFVRSFIIKDGFDINALMRQAEQAAKISNKDMPKSSAWKGVCKYIEETDLRSLNH